MIQLVNSRFQTPPTKGFSKIGVEGQSIDKLISAKTLKAQSNALQCSVRIKVTRNGKSETLSGQYVMQAFNSNRLTITLTFS